MHLEAILRQHNVRDTLPRRLVLRALSHMRKPTSPQKIHQWTISHHNALNLVTVYRVLDAFERAGMVHRQPHSGGILLCSLLAHKGHHGFLSCQKCGNVKEFCDPELCLQENRIAKKAGFRPKSHVSEILGMCSSCTRSRP